MQYLVNEEALLKVLKYLGGRPFSEVHELVTAIQMSEVYTQKEEDSED